MTVFETCQSYSPEITVEYNETKNLYVAKMISQSGCYELEGPDKNAIMFEMEAILRKELTDLSLSIEKESYVSLYNNSKKSRGQGIGIGGSAVRGMIGLGAVAGAGASIGSSAVRGMIGLGKGLKGHRIKKISGEQVFMKREEATVGLGLGGLIGSLLGKGVSYVAKVGGIVFVGTSRRDLKKKITRHKNMVIFRIMSNVRYHKNVEKRVALDRANERTRKLKKKREVAKTFWKTKSLNTGRDLRWEERIERMRGKVYSKKNQAFRLWVERIL